MRYRSRSALALMALAACNAPVEEPTFEVRDSAGVSIVRSREPLLAPGEGITVSAVPAVVIGAATGPQEDLLTNVTDAAVLPDGRIVLINAGAAELQLRGPDGALVRTFGRRGGGPGEFQGPEWLAIRADTLMVFDPRQDNRRLTLFDLTGELLGTETVQAEGVPYPAPKTVLSDGAFFDERAVGSIGWLETGHSLRTRFILRYERVDGTADTVATGPGREIWQEEFRNGISSTEVPFGRSSFTAHGSARFYLGNGSRAVIDGYGLGGEHVLSIHLEAPLIPVSEDDRQRWIEAKLSGLFYQTRPEIVPRNRRRFEASPLPSHMPVHADLIVDIKERLWVRRYSPPWAERSEWWVFAPDGRWLDTVTLPPSLEVFEIGATYVLGLRTDDLGVEYVELYSLSEESGRGPGSG